MNRLHIIGRKNHGKTQLVVELVEELRRRGLCVGTIKHTHHHHELDTPGKDSHRHRSAGSARVGILSPSMSAIFLPAEHLPATCDRYAAFAPLYADCDLVLVEGDSQTAAPKIEVWRAALGTPPIAAEGSSLLAVISDDPCPIRIPTLPRSDLPGLARWIIDRPSFTTR